ncbi:hypothetical protein BDV93DRAFT_562781 [Ceratobasidium sp. AG-I]|nr:hypothetical protein BDV93DRAFT_562781 [Ceratobasidium sp. AG-I]
MRGATLILFVSIGIAHAQGDKRSTSTTRISTTRISTTRSLTSSSATTSSPAINSSTISSSTTTSSAAPTTPTILPGWGGQCGGVGYTGPTTCASPYTCHVLNEYASQCW